MRWRSSNRRLRSVLAGALAVTLLPLAVQASDDIKPVDKKTFDRLAKELIADVQRTLSHVPAQNKTEAAINYLKKAYAHAYGKKPRIALWPFRRDLIPISKIVADQVNDSFLASLLDHAAGRYEFVARDALKAIISDLHETGGLDVAPDDPIAALMQKARKIDILIEGKMHLDGRRISLTYKAVRMDGAIAGQTSPAYLHLKDPEVLTPPKLLSIDQAIDAAARALADQAGDMTELRLGGIRYQKTGLQPDFARFLQSKLSAALEMQFSNVISERHISVVESQLDDRLRGVTVEEKQLRDESFANDDTSYLLSGDYWLLADTVELRFNLKNRRNKSASWTGRIAASSASGLQIKPASDFENMRENDGLGPFKFQLTSGKGRDPIYRIDEKLDLVIRADDEAWVYCFYRQANDKVIQIFPNPFFWKRFKSPRLAAGVAHTVPGEKLFPFDLKITPPAGRELVKCFAASRDITAELPKGLRGTSLLPLPETLVGRLSDAFRAPPHTAIAEASLVVTVVKP